MLNLNSKKGVTALTVAVSMICGALTSAIAADYPSNTIRTVVPWRAGGGTDSVARALAAAMEPIAGQAVIVENITGGAGNAGMLAGKDAKADGYTMLLNGSSDITAPMVFRDVPYDLSKDYVCVGAVYQTPAWMLANTERGYKTFDDFVAKAKANPGKLTLGVTALATPDHVMADLLVKKHGIDVRIIPFNGGAPLKKALIGNQVDAGVLIAPVMLSEVKSGLVNVLVSGGSLKNINHAPLHNTKTLADYGVDVEVGSVRGVLLPKATPKEVVSKAEDIVGKAAHSDSFTEFATNFGFAPIWMSGQKFCDFMEDELKIYQSVK